MRTKYYQIIVFLVLLAPLATASPIVPHFYHVKVQLTNGKVLTGNTWGISWMGGGLFQERKIKRVDLKSTSDTVAATFYLLEKDVVETFTVSTKDHLGQPRTIVLSSSYERYDNKGDLAYFWVKDGEEIPLTQISSIETMNVIGSGHAVDDPRPYQNVQEPFIVVEDCGLGCSVKLFSRDRTVTKVDLKRIWAGYLNCKSVMSEAEQIEVKKKHQLVLITDPFCTD